MIDARTLTLIEKDVAASIAGATSVEALHRSLLPLEDLPGVHRLERYPAEEEPAREDSIRSVPLLVAQRDMPGLRLLVDGCLMEDEGFVSLLNQCRRVLENGLSRIRETDSAHKRLQKRLADADLTARELRHRVGNSLQLIQDLVVLIGSENAINRAVVDRMEGCINAIAEVHKLFGANGENGNVAIPTYLRALTSALQRGLTDERGHIVLYLEGDGFPSISERQATSIGLIIHELVMNARKHSGEPFVRILIRAEIQEGRLWIGFDEEEHEREAEDGIPTQPPGSPSRRPSRQRPTKGKRIIEQLSQRSGGDILEDKGYRFVATFPIRQVPRLYEEIEAPELMATGYGGASLGGANLGVAETGAHRSGCIDHAMVGGYGLDASSHIGEIH